MSKATGVILDENGKPLSGVTVNLNNGDTKIESTITDNNGRWTIDNIAVESTNGLFEFLKDGYLRTYYPSNNYSSSFTLDSDVNYLSKVPIWVYFLVGTSIAVAIFLYIKNKK